MFQKQIYDIEQIEKMPMPHVEVTELNRNNQSITIYRTKRENVSDPYIFYLQGFMKIHPDRDNQKSSEKDTIAKILTKENLLEEIKKTIAQLPETYELKLNGDFVQAVKFTDEDTGTQFMIETTEEVIFFNWMKN